MTMTQSCIGVDVSKDWIDVFDGRDGSERRIATERGALRRFARQAAGTLVVLEASGAYERPLTDALEAAGTPYVRVNPRQAREFARATGRLAKTDRVDAAVLANMGVALRLTPTLPISAARRRLAALLARREDIRDALRREKNRLSQAQDTWVRRDVASMVSILERRLQGAEAEIAALVTKAFRENTESTSACRAFGTCGAVVMLCFKYFPKRCSDPELSRLSVQLQSAKGIGPLTAAILLASLPELGSLDRRAIASLAGLAPQANEEAFRENDESPSPCRVCDTCGAVVMRCLWYFPKRSSGKRRGQRTVWGGRPHIRRAMFIAALVASRTDHRMKAFRERLEANGKSKKAAILATARKLLTILNAMLKTAKPYEPA